MVHHLKKNVFLSFAAYLFFLDTIGTFIEFLVCMFVIFVLSTISFIIIRLRIATLFIILQQLRPVPNATPLMC